MVKQGRHSLLAGIAIALFASGGPATATELIYTPINPNFGGSPFNGPPMLDNALSQNKYTEDNGSGAGSLDFHQPTALEEFNDTLQRTILSRLAASATSQITGQDGNLRPGTVETTDFSISIVDVGGGMLKILTTDKSTGAQTSFQVGQ